MSKTVPLNDLHLKLGARMTEFAGFSMPVYYKAGITAEHLAVRRSVGVFDISHMGEFILFGKDAADLMQYIMTNDIDILPPGKAQYACMCYPHGGTVDDSFYYRETGDRFRLIVNAANREKDKRWILEHAEGRDVELMDVSDRRVRFAVQGPKSAETLEPIFGDIPGKLHRFHHTFAEFGGTDVFISYTGYTGEKGYELTLDAEYGEALFKEILRAGEPFGILPCGLGARDTLRLEACYSLYSHELSDDITPIEADIGFCVKEKKTDYLGKEVLLKQKKEGTSRKIVALELEGKGIMRSGYRIFDDNKGDEIGFVTSGAYSPTFRKSIALAMLRIDYTAPDTIVSVGIRKKHVPARVVKKPFYPFAGGKNV